jgi:hypothetical protein
MVCYDELEKEDWEEIVSLIEQRNKEKEIAFKKRGRQICQKLNDTPGLYYYQGGRDNAQFSSKNMRRYITFLGGNGNGLTHHCYIAENHPVLNNFSFQIGFYLIDNDKRVEKNVGSYEGGFENSGGETNPNNFQKFIEVGDEITITPYEIDEDKELLENQEKKGDCNICQKNLQYGEK